VARRDEPIKFVHTGDWHLGVSNLRILDDAGLPLQYSWVERAVDKLGEYVTQNGVHLVFLCGDMLHTKSPSPTVENILARMVRKLTACGAVVVAIPGNHEISATGANPLTIYQTLAVEGVTIFDSPKLTTLTLFDGRNVQIAGVPFSYKFNLRENLTELAAQIDPAVPAFAMMHILVEGAKHASGTIKALPDEQQMSPFDFNDLPFAYVALGHVHKAQNVWARPVVEYCGSIQIVDFSEQNEDKGFVAGELHCDDNGYIVRREFIPVQTAKYITLRVDVRAESNPTEKVIATLGAHNIEYAVLRVIVDRNMCDAGISQVEIRAYCERQHVLWHNVTQITQTVENTAQSKAEPLHKDLLANVSTYIETEQRQFLPMRDDILEQIRLLIEQEELID